MHFLKRMPISGAIEIRISGLSPFTIDPVNLPEATNLYWDPVYGYEPGSIPVIVHLLSTCKTVLDIGAHQGLYTLIFASHPSVTSVHAFEPNPQTFPYLSTNIQVNSLQHVILQQMAVSDVDGHATLYSPNNNSAPLDASMLKGFRPSQTGISITSTTLSRYVSEQNLKIDFIKIDTEATEPNVLHGGSDIIQSQRPIIMCEVLAARTETALEEFFQGKSYSFYQITRSGLVHTAKILGDRTHQNLNYLFMPEEKQELIAPLLSAHPQLETYSAETTLLLHCKPAIVTYTTSCRHTRVPVS